MKLSIKALRGLAACVLGLMLTHGWAATLTEDQKAVKQLMTKMYSYSINNFEYAEYNGKYDLSRLCKLQSQFFDASLLVSQDKKKPCQKSGRYTVGSSELLRDMQDTALPTKIATPVVEGDVAAVEVITDLRHLPLPEGRGRIVWFLNKTPVGWRIVNSLDFENWPIKDGKCWGDFGSPPTPWQKQFEAPQCKPGFVDKQIH
ncbi:hypothetical protein [Rhodoferax aquaticus]|uniref:Nuclear transport factor 2 family protein n=1 Tax=Rhodoferax aquaticus TaxID=2527691 RepID=A0A515EUR7_9BURK|nr:hypothetical protein [Rhodoferax aquaticus]QDL56411.1 hypothetical protein EXZ61_20875 [Rhodoferax aquaticus]